MRLLALSFGFTELLLDDGRIQRFQKFECTEEILRNAHTGAIIIEFSTVVWRAEHGDQSPIVPELITIFHNHVCTTNEVHIPLGEKVVDDALAETIAHASLVVLPIYGSFGWI